MNLQKRLTLMAELGQFLRQNTAAWQSVCDTASRENPWFTPEFIKTAVSAITENYLDTVKMKDWCGHYHLNDSIVPRNVGIVMAGNIPLVGFHDFLCVFLSGHRQQIKLSSKDQQLLTPIIHKLYEWDPDCKDVITIAGQLKGCDAYIATGNDQSAAHFKQYFGMHPHVVRHNRTSVAILNGKETSEELEKLSDDIHTYFGLGCRNVTKLYVPKDYDFIPLLRSFHQYEHFRDHVKYSHNFDFRLSVFLLNNQQYMTNQTTLLVEDNSVFSPISVLHYGFYDNADKLAHDLQDSEEIQCIVGNGFVPFGKAQQPDLFSYADGVDTMQFLLTI